MTTNASSTTTIRPTQRAPRILHTAASGLALLMVTTACQPETTATSPGISVFDVEGAAADQFPTISQELEVDPVITTTTGPISSDSTRPSTTLPPTTAATTAVSAQSTVTSLDVSPTTISIPVGPNDFPGTALDYGPPAGASLDVVGVRHDDVLNFRADPDPTSEVVASVAPIHGGYIIVASGQAWIAPSGTWWKVTVNGEAAWANQSYLAGIGHGDDFFIDVSEELGVLRFETIADAAQAVAGTQMSETPESRVVVVAAPVTYDSGAGMTIDVLDLGDDSMNGIRIWIEVEFIYDDSGETVESVVLTDVYMNPLCGRGVSVERLCL